MTHRTDRAMHSAMVLMSIIACFFIPMTGLADTRPHYPHWIDDIKGAIAFYKGDAYYKKEYPTARWDLYLDQMREVETAYQKADVHTTYAAMNRFMDMLEAREGGIPVQPAHELFNLCNFVTPPTLHDVTRHAGPPRMEQPKMPEGAEWPG